MGVIKGIAIGSRKSLERYDEIMLCLLFQVFLNIEHELREIAEPVCQVIVKLGHIHPDVFVDQDVP